MLPSGHPRRTAPHALRADTCRTAGRGAQTSSPYVSVPSPRLSIGPIVGLPVGEYFGYTHGMKIAISIPDEVYQGAERLARRAKKSRSRLYGEALKEYLARHAPDEVTDAMNRACAEVGNTQDPFVSSAARRVLERSEW